MDKDKRLCYYLLMMNNGNNNNNTVDISPRSKRIYVDMGLNKYQSIFIYLDGRMPGVLIPARLRLNAQVNLQFGLNMPVPIPDLRIDDTGIYGTLSFKQVPFTCFIPWDAIYAMVTDKGDIIPFRTPPSMAYIEAGMVPGVESITKAYTIRTGKEKSQHTFKKSTKEPAARPSYLRVVK